MTIRISPYLGLDCWRKQRKGKGKTWPLPTYFCGPWSRISQLVHGDSWGLRTWSCNTIPEPMRNAIEEIEERFVRKSQSFLLRGCWHLHTNCYVHQIARDGYQYYIQLFRRARLHGWHARRDFPVLIQFPPKCFRQVIKTGPNH